MSFSFNWAGLSIPTISGKRDVQIQNQQANIAGNLGSALRGYEDRKLRDELNDEYANLLNGYSTENPNVKSIQEQIAQLEATNAELMRQKAALGG